MRVRRSDRTSGRATNQERPNPLPCPSPGGRGEKQDRFRAAAKPAGEGAARRRPGRETVEAGSKQLLASLTQAVATACGSALDRAVTLRGRETERTRPVAGP